jgi:hypothetical protein
MFLLHPHSTLKNGKINSGVSITNNKKSRCATNTPGANKKVMSKTTTIFINNNTSNPIAVGVTIEAEEMPVSGWSWTIEKINCVELVISDKVGIDITRQIQRDARALALLTAQLKEEDDQVIDFLTDERDVNEEIDELQERRREAV